MSYVRHSAVGEYRVTKSMSSVCTEKSIEQLKIIVVNVVNICCLCRNDMHNRWTSHSLPKSVFDSNLLSKKYVPPVFQILQSKC
jgi:hypothetical protein